VCYLARVPADDHRQKVYEALRDAGPEGMTAQALWGCRVSNLHAHIESLRFEGHVITQKQINGLWGWSLDHDAWSGKKVSGAAAEAILSDAAPAAKKAKPVAQVGTLEDLIEKETANAA
jgi:hypothetical protein